MSRVGHDRFGVRVSTKLVRKLVRHKRVLRDAGTTSRRVGLHKFSRSPVFLAPTRLLHRWFLEELKRRDADCVWRGPQISGTLKTSPEEGWAEVEIDRHREESHQIDCIEKKCATTVEMEAASRVDHSIHGKGKAQNLGDMNHGRQQGGPLVELRDVQRIAHRNPSSRVREGG